MLIGETLDKQVRQYLQELRDRGGVVNTAIAIGCGTGIVMSQDPTLLASNGGGVTLTKDWAKYLLRHMGFVKRRGSTKAEVAIEDFEAIKELYLLDIKMLCKWMRFLQTQ